MTRKKAGATAKRSGAAARAKFPKISPDEASQIIKKFATKQKISIKLTEEQLANIMRQWNEGDPRLPAEITFHVGRRKVIDLKVAGYRYRGDTCCV